MLTEWYNARMHKGSQPKVERNQRIVILKEEGLSFRQIARALTMDVSQVYKIYKRDLKKYSSKATEQNIELSTE